MSEKPSSKQSTSEPLNDVTEQQTDTNEKATELVQPSIDSDLLAYGRASGLTDAQSEHLSTYL